LPSLIFLGQSEEEAQFMRIDKFLKNSRLIKRRSVAKEACDGGRISINGKEAKAGTDVKLGDVIEIVFGDKKIRAKVLALTESARKDDAADMYEILDTVD